MIESRSLHLILLQLIAAVDDDLLRLEILEHDLNEFLAERSRAACDQYNLIFPIHSDSSVYLLLWHIRTIHFKFTCSIKNTKFVRRITYS